MILLIKCALSALSFFFFLIDEKWNRAVVLADLISTSLLTEHNLHQMFGHQCLLVFQGKLKCKCLFLLPEQEHFYKGSNFFPLLALPSSVSTVSVETNEKAKNENKVSKFITALQPTTMFRVLCIWLLN